MDWIVVYSENMFLCLEKYDIIEWELDRDIRCLCLKGFLFI